jgi:hypothetical protein
MLNIYTPIIYLPREIKWRFSLLVKGKVNKWVVNLGLSNKLEGTNSTREFWVHKGY